MSIPKLPIYRLLRIIASCGIIALTFCSFKLSPVDAALIVSAPVVWSEEDGGNDHRYQVAHSCELGSVLACARTDSLSWIDARVLANNLGGYLATITSAEEQAFVNSFIEDFPIPTIVNSPRTSDLIFDEQPNGWWLGGFQDPAASEADSGWNWLTNEVFDYTNWSRGEPNDFSGVASESFLHMWGGGTFGRSRPRFHWNDEAEFSNTGIISFLVELPALPEPTTLALVVLAVPTWSGFSRARQLTRFNRRIG
ncbi:MAG: lectin-like protein [Planctomycetota bacterium]